MSGRVLAVVAPGEEAAALDGLTGLLTIARAADADVRLAYLRDLPPPRVDMLDHVVADADAEMARITASVVQTFDAAARRHGDVKVETVVRFGSPGARGGRRSRGLCAPDHRGLRRGDRPRRANPWLGAPAAARPPARRAAARAGSRTRP
jgi:hypothetical protein